MNDIRKGWYEKPNGEKVRVVEGVGMTVHYRTEEGDWRFGQYFDGSWEYLGKTSPREE